MLSEVAKYRGWPVTRGSNLYESRLLRILGEVHGPIPVPPSLNLATEYLLGNLYYTK
jgi:hypothetical protein